jgi:hypothetical protein
MGTQIEFANCYQLQNQQVTISFYAQANNANAASTALIVRTRTSATVDASVLFTGTVASTNQTITTSGVRYSVTRTLPATFGALSLEFASGTSGIAGDGFTITGVQIDKGSVALPFRRAGGTISGELAACQRYLPTVIADGSIADLGTGFAYSTTQAYVYIPFKVTPRVKPTGITVSAVGDFGVRNSSASILTSTNVAINTAGTDGSALIVTVASGLVAGNGTTFIKGTTGSILFTGCEF